MTKTDGDRLLRAAVDLLSRSNTVSPGATQLFDIVEELAPGRVGRARRRRLNARLARVEAARWVGPVPAWAKRMMERHVCDATMRWSPVVRDSTSGRYMTGLHQIVINAGTDEVDQRRVVLHEIAHALTPRHGHDATFWDEAYRLAVHEGMVESMKARMPGTRSFTAAQRRARRSA